MKNKILLFLFISSIISTSYAQEILTGLQQNPVIKQELRKIKNIQSNESGIRKLEIPTSIQLPFFDDFHNITVFPDTNKWLDNYVFINADFPFYSANVGAATFDAIDNTGNLYPDASTFPFIADHLTSFPIRLDSVLFPEPAAITLADSVYFSFYYQPQGRGNKPEKWDSLVLQFGHYTDDSIFSHIEYTEVPISSYIPPGDTIFPFDTLFAPSGCNQSMFFVVYDTLYYDDTVTMPCDSVYTPKTKWYYIWSSPGMRLDTFHHKFHTYCKQVLIPIKDSTRYYRKDFQFRFFNYASLASSYVPSWRSNCDQWNVDYIYLNIGRSKSDSTYRDISFVEKAPSMLKKYQSMPYSQYKNNPTNEMQDSIRLFISNLYNEAFNTDYAYYVSEVGGTFNFYHDGGGCNLPPFYEFGYQKCDETCGASRACPTVNFIYPLGFGKDSILLEVKHIISGFTAADTVGDTIILQQKLYNYYAYDDGTPEFGYGVNSAYGKVAYRFKLNIKDTLRAVRMYFNRTEGNANDQYFDLAVWRDNDGEPGEIIHLSKDMKPKFSDNLYQIQTYYFENPVPVSSIFYIGWIQSTSENLNVGFDSYNDASSNIYYNVTGEWIKTSYTGSLIMRPVIGKKFDPAGIINDQLLSNDLLVFPNPTTNGKLHIRLPDHYQYHIQRAETNISIFNVYGQIIFTSPYKETIDISGLSNGMYIIRLNYNSNKLIFTGKVLVNR